MQSASALRRLIGELLSALRSAAGKNLAAVSVSHSFAEAVFHLAMALLGLVSSFHNSNLRFIINHNNQKVVANDFCR